MRSIAWLREICSSLNLSDISHTGFRTATPGHMLSFTPADCALQDAWGADCAFLCCRIARDGDAGKTRPALPKAFLFLVAPLLIGAVFCAQLVAGT
jgi:hypothetical protein